MEGKKFTAPKKQFKTTNGTPETPAGFTAKITGSNAQLDWESVQCATGFKIYKVRLLVRSLTFFSNLARPHPLNLGSNILAMKVASASDTPFLCRQWTDWAQNVWTSCKNPWSKVQ